MADIRKLWGTSQQKETEGVVHDLGNGVEVTVARNGNPKHAAALERLSKPYRGQINRGTLPKEKLEALSIEAMAEGLLLGWKGIELDGQALEYTKANALKVLTEFKDFREMISSLAVDAAQYREEEIVEAEKN